MCKVKKEEQCEKGNVRSEMSLHKGICISTVAATEDNLCARFPHDGATVHFTRPIRNHGREFRNRCIFAGDGGFAWPSRSPELIPLEFFILEPP
jgi:hypothetical protein